MTTAHERLKEIEQYRRVYFGSADGKQVLCDALESLGILAEPDAWNQMLENPGPSLRLLIEGLLLLKDLGVMHPSNYAALIDAMAGLPLPELERNEDDSA